MVSFERIAGGVAQLGEHLPCKQGVSGSIPLVSTTTFTMQKLLFSENSIEERNLLKVKTKRELNEVKLIRAYGGCLGAKSRRRTG